MLFFNIPLLAFAAGQVAFAIFLMLPSPLSTPAIMLAQWSNTKIGKAITYTFGTILAIFLASPVHDMYILHQQKEASAETLTSKDRRGTEAAAHLALLLVLVNLVFPVINQALGLALAEAEALRAKLSGAALKES